MMTAYRVLGEVGAHGQQQMSSKHPASKTLDKLTLIEQSIVSQESRLP